MEDGWAPGHHTLGPRAVNTRCSLWPERWPLSLNVSACHLPGARVLAVCRELAALGAASSCDEQGSGDEHPAPHPPSSWVFCAVSTPPPGDLR